MLKQRAKLVMRFLFAADIALTAVSFFLAYYLWAAYVAGSRFGVYAPLERYDRFLIIIIPVWSLLLHLFAAYRSYRTASIVQEIMIFVKVVAVGGIILGASLFSLKEFYFSRTFLFIFLIINLTILVATRSAVRLASWNICRKGHNFRNVLIVGTDDTALQVADIVGKYKQWGLRVVGFVHECRKEHVDSVGASPVLGCIDDIEAIIKRENVDEVIFSVVGKKLDRFEEVFLLLEDYGINTRMVANIFPHIIAKLRLDQLESIPLLTFTTVPTDLVRLALKRLFDIAASWTLLVIAAPLTAMTVIAVKATSPGPVFFRQNRIGLNGRVFTLLKFRSMYVNAEVRKKDLETLNEMDGPVFKIKDDPRITPIGGFLRKSSIDELPQLWNVLKGDMSIVGPRPLPTYEVERFERWQRRRLSMRPGLTCLWQISGRNRVKSFDEWVRLDLQYIDTWSLGLDMMIFLKTIPVVLMRKGAG